VDERQSRKVSSAARTLSHRHHIEAASFPADPPESIT